MLPTITAVTALLSRPERRAQICSGAIMLITLTLAPLFVLGAESFGVGLALIALLIAPIVAALVFWRPLAGWYLVVGAVLLIEQDALGQDGGGATPVFTDMLPVFHWPPGSALEGFVERPIGLLFLLTLFALIRHRLRRQERPLLGGALLWPFVLFLLCVAEGVLHGLTSGGDLKITVVEVRPFWYFFLAYLLAYNAVTHTRHLRVFFWLVLVSAGVKALQGVFVFLVYLHGHVPANNLLSHEESYFFAAAIVLFILLSLYHRDQPQWRLALLIMPLVVFALVANQRRADYIALLAALGVIWLFLFCLKPRLRVRLVAGMLICVVLGAGYIVAFTDADGWIGAPARAIVSLVQPVPGDATKADSNAYRVAEDTDLKTTALQYPVFGMGFGKKFLQPVPLTDLSALDPNYVYIPHNTIYWVWMRLGGVGFFVFWYLLGSAIVRGGLLARRLRDPYIQLTAIYIICCIVMEIIVAFADYQLFDFRTVMYAGLLMGILMKLPALAGQIEGKELSHLAGSDTAHAR